MKSLSMENVSVKMVTISLAILVEFVLQPKFMILPIESVTLHARRTKSGIQLSELVDVYLPTTL